MQRAPLPADGEHRGPHGKRQRPDVLPSGRHHITRPRQTVQGEIVGERSECDGPSECGDRHGGRNRHHRPRPPANDGRACDLSPRVLHQHDDEPEPEREARGLEVMAPDVCPRERRQKQAEQPQPTREWQQDHRQTTA